MAIKILIVEDEFLISNLIRESLGQQGYQCVCVYDGKACADILENEQFDLVLLDVMLPKIDGFELIGYIREYHIPVIFITAKVDVKDRVKGLKLGAEDYITKPFSVEELLARVEVVLRRENKLLSRIVEGNLEVDVDAHTVRKSGKIVELTVKEFDILLLFLKNKNIALYRETIYERVWKSPFMGETRTVDLHVQRLRKKLGMEDQILSIYKVGYKFVTK
ncbi:MAG: response regulator transcription factor [Lachnospiraceae bacterium]|nr:response regulator transcription factor [Lachnospiraceae bacterium]